MAFSAPTPLTHACFFGVCLGRHLISQGTILIAVNPLRKVADPEMSTFMNHSLDPERPHPYAIAEVSESRLRKK